MKTAISIPNATFAEAEKAAARLGISRSEFFTQAAQFYIREMGAQDVTSHVDLVLQRVSGDSDSDFAVDAGRRLLDDAGDDW